MLKHGGLSVTIALSFTWYGLCSPWFTTMALGGLIMRSNSLWLASVLRGRSLGLPAKQSFDKLSKIRY